MDREWSPANNFAQHPRSVTEVRADRSNAAVDAQPRDVLVEMLRRIDSGELDCPALIVVYDENEDGRPFTTYVAGGAALDRRTTAVGMLEVAKFQMMVE